MTFDLGTRRTIRGDGGHNEADKEHNKEMAVVGACVCGPLCVCVTRRPVCLCACVCACVCACLRVGLCD